MSCEKVNIEFKVSPDIYGFLSVNVFLNTFRQQYFKDYSHSKETLAVGMLGLHLNLARLEIQPCTVKPENREEEQ